MAKQQADKPDEDDIDLRKKLWLRIGKFSGHFDRVLIQHPGIHVILGFMNVWLN